MAEGEEQYECEACGYDYDENDNDICPHCGHDNSEADNKED